MNGRLPDSALAPIAGGRLAKAYAVRWNLMNFRVRAAGRPTILPNGPMSSYRTLAQQVFLRRQWCAEGHCENAAVPGTSNHGDGRAVDNGRKGEAIKHGHSVGVRDPSDAPWEPWHTLVHLDPLPPGAVERYPTIRRGSRDRDSIRRLQRLLRGLHLTNVVNGRYGLWTRRAVRRFQSKHHLPVDGVVGRATWRAIIRATGGKP